MLKQLTVLRKSLSRLHLILKIKKYLLSRKGVFLLLKDKKVILKEIYDGIDIQKDVLDKMEFIPEIDININVSSNKK